MQIQQKPITDIKPYTNNAKLHPVEQIEQIKNSIIEFGNNDPIAVDENGVIIEGHGRYQALTELGYETVPVIVLEGLTEEQKNAYRITHNQLTMNTDWDMEALKKELENITLDMDALGLDVSMLDDLALDERTEVKEDDFEGELPETAQAQYGDIYKLGEHMLMCGDATKYEDVARLMGGTTANLLITDPPYNVDYEGTAGKIQNDNMSNDDFRKFLTSAFDNAKSVMENGASFYIWHADSEGYNFRGACFDVGLQVRQCLIWVKNALVMGRQDYQWQHEPCLYGWKDGGTHSWYSDRKQTTILNFDKPRVNDLHPTMKPLALIGYQIENSSKKHDIVLDLFGGSGSTLIACEQLERKCYMMELDPRYVDVIIKRWEEYTGGTAERIASL